MGEYHNFYFKSNVLLLADVFEKFRSTCLQYYKLDPCHIFTSPGLSRDAILKMTGINLELMTDIDQFLFIEKGIRGGVSYIPNRYVKANNPYISTYNPDQPSNYISYLDANNLYEWAMSQNLPTSCFQWVDTKVYDNKLLNKMLDNLPDYKRFIFEADLEYPEHLHDLYNDYPFAPEKIEIQNHMLSDYCKQFNVKVGRVSKLVPNLHAKKNYVFS